MKQRTIVFYTLLIAVLVVLQCSAIGFAYAKYVNDSDIDENATVAKFEIAIGDLTDDDNSYNIVLADAKPSMSTKNYSFKITNGTLSNYSDVALKYTITITNGAYLPLDIVLTDENSVSLSLSSSVHTLTTSSYNLVAGSFDECEYNLTIDWRSGDQYKNYAYSGIIDFVQIHVSWEQVN